MYGNVTNTVFGQGHLNSHSNKWTLFLWHMPDDATEGVAELSSRLQPSINLYVPVTAFSTGLVSMYYPKGMKG